MPPFAAQQSSAAVEFSTHPPGEEVTIKAREQEKRGDVFMLRGDVEIQFRGLVLRADEIIYDAATGDVTAAGHVSAEGGPHDEHIEASRAEYNVRKQTGRFYDVVGTTGARFQGRNVTLTSSSPFAFTGKLVEKVSRDRYIVHGGSVTSCELPNPKWTFNAGKIVVDIGGTAKIYHTTFRVKKVPILYLPFAAHPVDRLGRQSGFLIPTFGTSSRKGTIIGDSFYWAINRSFDLTLGAEYFSRRGWSQTAEFRGRPSETSAINFKYFGVLDRGIWQSGQLVDQGGQDILLNAEGRLRGGFRGVANVEYLSSFVFRLAFTEAYSQTVNSEVKSVAFLSNTWRGFSFNAMAARYQNFQSTVRGDVVTIVHAPSANISSVDRSLGGSRLHWGFDVALEGVSRKEPEPGFHTSDLVGRVDLHPRASLPLFIGGWTFRPEVALRNTWYSERQLPDPLGGPGTPVDQALNRVSLEASMEVRPPTLGRIFDKPVWGRRLKHTIEPRIIYRYVGGVDNLRDIIRFDWRDILSNTSELEYALVQRLYSKRVEECAAGAPPAGAAASSPPSDTESSPAVDRRPSTDDPPGDCASARELITWELAQKYFFDSDFGGMVVTGKRNVFTTTVGFAGIAFLTEPRRFSPVVSRLRVRSSANADVEWQFDYDPKLGRVSSSTALAQLHFGDYFLGGSHAFLRAPGEIFVRPTPLPAPDRFNQFRLLAGYGTPAKRGVGVTASVGFDSNLDFLQYASFQGSYNWDCCGLAMEYRRYALGPVRNENQFRFAFTLANIGTFGNLKRQERLF